MKLQSELAFVARGVSFTLFALALAGLATAAEPAKKPKPAPAKAGKMDETLTQKPAPQLSPVAAYAKQSGMVRCVDRLDQFSKFVTANSQSGAFVFMPKSEVDSQMASISFEVLSPEALAYASVTTAPKWNGCGGEYEAVVYWPVNCEEVALKHFPNTKPTGLLKKNITLLGEGSNMKVFLMPAGPGCVSIKKEILY
jgi:hypothetical protein